MLTSSVKLQNEDEAVFIRFTGAALRAVFVAVLVMLPAFILPGVTQSGLEFTRVLAIVVAVFVIYEYGFATPSVIEFRDVSPYNRIRFLLLLLFVLVPSQLISHALNGVPLAGSVSNFASDTFSVVNFSFSPVTIVAKTLSANNIALREAVEQAVAFNMVISLFSVLTFAVVVFGNLWRFGCDQFNMWHNMPSYKSYGTAGMQKRLINSAFASLLVACLIPLLGPTAADVFLIWFTEAGVLPPIAITWFIALWAYLPVMYLMRAIVLAKVAINHANKNHWIAA